MQQPSESPVWSGASSQWLNIGTFIVTGIVAAAIIIGAFLWDRPLIALAALIPAALAFWSWLTVRTTRIDISTERVTTTTGIFSRKRSDMELYRVKDTTLHEPFLLRLVRRSTIELASSDRSSPSMMIRAIPNGETLRQEIRTHVERLRRDRRVRELDMDIEP